MEFLGATTLQESRIFIFLLVFAWLTAVRTCPVASGLLQRRAGRSSSFHTGTVPLFQRVLHAAARYRKTSYSTCPVASGLLQRRAGRSSSFHTGTISASPARSGMHRSESQPRDRVTPALQELHWLPVAERIQYKLCLLVHKSLLGHTPRYISNLLTSVANIPGRCTLRASSCGNLVVPRTRRWIGDRTFSVASAPVNHHLSFK